MGCFQKWWGKNSQQHIQELTFHPGLPKSKKIKAKDQPWKKNPMELTIFKNNRIQLKLVSASDSKVNKEIRKAHIKNRGNEGGLWIL